VADRAVAAVTFPEECVDLARRLLAACEARGWRLTTAESCTGGLIVACLTEIPGSSAVVERGYVTYDNRAKQEMLGVPARLLQRVGAVSAEVARTMAEGARERAGVDLAIAVTGIAGPSGATPAKPVGLVHLALARRGVPPRHVREVFAGDRSAIRMATVERALRLALAAAT
jgi:nicotinamide-nucleotide amidase